MIDRLGEVAEQRAFRARNWRWPGCCKPGVTAPIVGASKPNHLKDAVAALSVKLTAEEMAKLEQPYAAHPVLGFS